MAKEKKDKHFIKKPVYEGGPKAMRAFIGEKLRYPAEAARQGVEGTVVVKYDIDYTGKVVDTKVVAGLGHGCDEEAERVVRLLRFEVPKSRGVRVLFHKSINIHFRKPVRVPKKKPSTGKGLQLKYTYVERPAPAPAEKAPPATSYTYTVNL